MNLIGILVVALDALLILPLAPFVVALKLVDWVRGTDEQTRREASEPPFEGSS